MYNLHIPVEADDYAQRDTRAPSHSPQAGEGENFGLSQGVSIQPYLHVQTLERENQILERASDIEGGGGVVFGSRGVLP